MTYQSSAQAWVAYKVQSALGTPASGSGGTVLRTTGGQGGRLTKAAYESGEIRRDGMSTRGRHGSRKTSGAYTSELSLGSHDAIMEAVFRGTWGSADLGLDESDFTSITTGANTIVLASGSPISLGLRVGDVIRITNQATSTGNNGKNLRITGLSSTTITVAETLTVNAVADTDCEITRPGRVLANPAVGSMVNRYFTIDEYEQDIDVSESFSDAMWGSFKLTMQPNGLITFDTNWVGNGKSAANATGESPVLTSPTESTGEPLAVVDATLRVNGTDEVDLTGLELMFDIAPGSVDTIGSVYSPDVFPGDMKISGSFSALRDDLAYLSDFMDETVYSLQILAVENESEPKSFVSIYLPNFTLGSVDKSALAKAGSARTQTMQIPAALVGKMPTTSGYDDAMAKIQVSNAS